jgi:hypothetical protein
MEKFKKIGMKSEEQITSIDDDGLIIQQGPPPEPFLYSFKAENDVEEKEEDFFTPDQHLVDESVQPLSVERGQQDINEETKRDFTAVIEESVTEEEITEESFYSDILPVASELLAVLASAEDPPGQGDVEVMEFEDFEQEDQRNEEDQDDTDTSVDSGPIPEEVKMEKDDLSSAYDPEAEYDASESSDEDDQEETEEDEDNEEVLEEEVIDETIESDSRGIEGEFMVPSVDVRGCYEEQDDKTPSDVENQSQHIFAALEKAPEEKEWHEQQGYTALDVAKRANSRSWTMYVLILALLLLAGVIMVLIILSQQDRENRSSSVVPIETPAPSYQPTITPIPTSLPSRTPSLQPTTTHVPTEVSAASPTNPLPSQSPMELNLPVENDTCDSAIGPIVSDGIFNFGTVTGATIDDVVQCGDVVDSEPGVWYYVLGTGGEMLAHTCQDTSFDSKITIFGAFCEKLVCIEANDNFCGEAGAQSAVSWLSIFRQEYRILVSGLGFTDGSFNLVVEARSNDECSTAIGPLSVGYQIPITGNTLAATPNAITCDGVTNESPSVWYLVTGTGSQMTASLCDDTDFMTRIHILTGSCTGLECIAVSGIIECSVSWNSVAFQDYYILISGQSNDDVGSFSMSLTTSDLLDNDECQNAVGPLSFDGDPIMGSTGAASPDLTVPICVSPASSNGVWYFLEGDGSSLQASLCDSATFDTRLSVYEGDCSSGDVSNLVCVGGNDDFCGAQSLVTFEALSGVRYYILVHGYGDSSGDFVLSLTLL